MNLESLVNLAGETAVLAAGGLLIGIAFGGFAQMSKFCLLSAVIEFSQGLLGSKIAIWLLTFSAAVVSTQAAIGFGLLDVTGARQLAARGSVSGSLVGGVMFGAGMILARAVRAVFWSCRRPEICARWCPDLCSRSWPKPR